MIIQESKGLDYGYKKHRANGNGAGVFACGVAGL